MEEEKNLEQLICYGHLCISIVTHEEQQALQLIRCAAMDLKRKMWVWSAGVGLREGLLSDSRPIHETELPAAGLNKIATEAKGSICVTLDLAPHLDNDLNLRILRDTITRLEKNDNILIMVDSSSNLPEVIKAYSKPFEISLPDEAQIEKIVYKTIRQLHKKKPFEIGISKKGMQAIIRNLKGLSERQAEQILKDCIADDDCFDHSDINRLLASKRQIIQQDGLLEYIQSPLTLDEIGGMDNIKNWLSLRKNTFSKQAREFGLSAPRGILILGVQGAGKSLCAKAVATAWQKPLFRLDPGVLYASYVGQSEAHLRSALRQTEAMAPVVLWIDEIEKGFASAASQSIDGGLSKRMFGTFLTWMQEHRAPVFLIATANDIQALPPELLRKGRFDEIFFVNLPDVKDRATIFEIHLRKRKRNPDSFDLEELAANSEGFSGAEIEQAIISGLHQAFSDQKDLNTQYILNELKNSPPLSATMAESVHSLCQWAKGRCVPAN
jgi:SpoVK/Ycf46/Vps4 family AAA+-type ATPase